MTLHKCKYCNYETTKYPSYEKHLLTQKHKKNVIQSRAQNQTNNNTYNNGNNIMNIIVENQHNLAKQNETVLKQNEELREKIELLEKSNRELKDTNNQNTNKIVKEARAIKKSILTILNTNFKDTPSINYIDENEFRKELELEYKATIADKDDKLFMRIFMDFEKKKLVKTLSDLILKFVKKEDQKLQPVFNIDSARGNYATKIQDFWHNDKSGLQLKKYTLDMIIKYMINVMDIYRQKLCNMYTQNKIDKSGYVTDLIMKNQSLLLEVNAFLTNSNTHKKVILFMCPELRLDNEMLESITN
jgi:hypothetical protein